jgi:hypothetical protein
MEPLPSSGWQRIKRASHVAWSWAGSPASTVGNSSPSSRTKKRTIMLYYHYTHALQQATLHTVLLWSKTKLIHASEHFPLESIVFVMEYLRDSQTLW